MDNFTKRIFTIIEDTMKEGIMSFYVRTLLLVGCFFLLSKAYAQPSLNSPTITAVGTTSATLGGKIATGTMISNYGTAYKTTSGVLSTDNPQSGGSIPDAAIPLVFSQNRTGLIAGTRYFWTCFATGTGGTGLMTEQSFFTDPSQPGTFTITAASTTNNQIVLSFPAASTLVGAAPAKGGYVLFRHAGSIATVAVTDGSAPLANGTGDKIATINDTNTTYTDGGLTAQTQYYYTLVPFVWDNSATTTYNYNTNSPLSANGYTLSNPPSGQPTTLSSSAASNTQINLTINWGAVTASGFLIYRNTTGTPVIAGGDFTNGTVPPNSLADGSSKVTSVASLATTFNDIGLTAATQYYYVLVPFGYDGSNSATYNYNTTSPKTTNSFTLFPPPSGQPSPLSASGASTSQINLTWTSVTATGFLIYRKAGATAPNVSGIVNGGTPPSPLGDGSTLITTAGGGATSYNDNSGLSPASQYSYTIVPFGYDGVNAATYNYLTTSVPIANAFTYSNPASGQPTSFNASATGINSINLTWSSGVTCSGFLLYRLPGNTSVNLAGLNSGSAPPATLGDGSVLVTTTGSGAILFNNNTGLTSGTKYQYKLVPFTWDGTNAGTYNFLTTGAKSSNATTFDNTSTITLNGGTTSPIDYASFQNTSATLDNSIPDCVSLGKFKITDLGGDGVPTTLTSVTIGLTNNSYISQIAIFDSGGTNRGQTTSPGASVTFSGLSGISAPNSGFDTFEIWATFKNSGIIDQSIITLTITGAVVSPSGSGLASFGATTGSSDKIFVYSNQLAYFVSGVPVASLPNTAPNTNFGPLTVTAVDGYGNVQLNRSSQVTLSLSSGSGTLDPSPGTLVQNLVSGTTTFSNLKITAAGAKTIKAAYQIVSVASGYININISSPGVNVTAGTVPTMCYSGDYQTITPITIVERDPADFASGGTFSLVLPTGFAFNTTITTAPSISGNEINTISILSYPASNTVQFSYNISGTTNTTLDQILINGLQVNYTGTTPATGNLVRFGGTAVQVGDASSDGKNFCTMGSVNSSTVVNFTVQTVPGQPSVNPTDTRFQVGINSVQLLGNPQSPSNGIFSGPGVSPNATYGYIFSPSSVGVSTGNQIVYTYKETSGQHCNVTSTKSFDVYASVIQGIQTQYCTNAPTSPALNVLQVDVDNQFPPAGSNAYYDLVYLYSYSFSSSTAPGPAYLGVYPTTNYIYSYTYTYNLLGTTTAAITLVNTYTYTYAYTLFYYVNTTYTSTPTVNYTARGTVNTFDPSQPYYKNYTSSGVFIYYRAINTASAISLGANQFVSLIPPPTVTFSMAKLAFCDYDAAVALVGSPTPVTPATDNFTGSAGIGTSITTPSTNNWLFSPSNIGTKSTPITITYHYTNPSTNCSNTATQIIQVNPKPSTVPSSNISVGGIPSVNLYSCQNLPLSPTIGKFDATPITVPMTTYKWYLDAGLTTPAGVAGNTLIPPVDITTIGATSYYVTQSVLGCESSGLTITANITTPVSIVAAAPGAICSSANFPLSTIGSIGGLISGGTTTGTWSGNGAFKDASLNTSTASGTATSYIPTSTERANGLAVITLTSNMPAAPNVCPVVSQNYSIPISTAITINPISPITVCPAQSSTPITITTTINGAGVSQATWTSAFAQGGFRTVGSLGAGVKPFTLPATTGNPIQVEYVPTFSEINSGSNVILSDINVASNSAGACSAANLTMALTINAAPKISVGADQAICADQSISLSGSFSGAASFANWTTSGTGNLTASNNAINPVTASYSLDPVVELPNQSQQVLTFTLTSNDPDGTGPTGPCIPDVKKVNVTINPIPQSPVINLPTYPNQQPAFCVNDPLVNNLSATGAAGNIINWYSNANATGAPLVTGTLNVGAFVNNAFAVTTSFYATQKTSAGCESKNQIPGGTAMPAQFVLVINPNPSLSFTASGTSANLTGLCLGDQTLLDASSSSVSSGGSITSYDWDFFDGSPKVSSATPTVTHQFALGNYNVQLTGTSNNLCKSVINASSLPSISGNLPPNSPLVIGTYPVSDFSIANQCYNDNTAFNAIDNASPKSIVSKWLWDFGDGNTSTKQFDTHLYSAPGLYTIKLTQTSKYGCVKSTTKSSYILPLIGFNAANQFGYSESFEDNSNVSLNNSASNFGAWANEILGSSDSSSWHLFAPNGNTISAASKGSNAWVAGLLPSPDKGTYSRSEISALNSPCFDISGLTKPVIAFDYFADTWLRNDGVYLQVSTDNGLTWKTFGSKGKGLNWYSDNSITALAGSGNLGQSVGQEGWDGQSKGWSTARYTLSSLPAKFRFRFYFGSVPRRDLSITTPYNGFGLDNVIIQNSNRTVLAENFTNNSATNAPAEQANFLNFRSNASQQALVKIEYHTNFGGADAENALNPADPQARAAFYGITSPFNGFIDGFSNGQLVPGPPATPSENYYDSRALVVSPVTINLSASLASPTSVAISTTINNILSSALPPGAASTNRYLVQMAIVENVNGQSILRKLLPDASGTPLTALAANSSQTITYTWQSSPPINPANLSAVCFVQDQTNQDILQAGGVALPISSLITAIEPVTAENIKVFPNPSDKEFTIILPNAASQTTSIQLANQLGQFTEVGAFSEGEQTKTVSTQGLTAGVYILMLGNNGSALRTKMIVLHK